MLYEIKETLTYFVEANSEDEAQELFNNSDELFNAHHLHLDIQVAE